MNDKANVCIHFIDNADDKLITKEYVCHVPRTGDEIRFGGQGNEKYYKVILVVWAYDEKGNPFDRVNVGVELIADSST